jgi:transposase
MDLTDDQWRLIQPLLPQHPSQPGRPWQDDRAVLNGVLWVMRTTSPWHRLPPQYPSYKTCHRRFMQWKRSGVMRRIFLALYNDLRNRGGLDLACFSSDGYYVFPKSGAPAWTSLARVDPEGSWQSSTAFIFITPLLKVLHRRLRSPSP